MTVLFGDFTDILGAAVPGYIEIRPKEMRPARQGTGVIVDKTVRVPLVSGAFRTGEIDPGVVVVTLHSGTGHGRVHESWEVHLPETGEMNLRDHVADRVTYSPEVVGQAQAAATTAARYAGVAQAAAENATSAESRVAGVVADGVATLKQHVATEVDAARAAREGAETARAGAETALQATTDARDATTAIQGTVAGYVASTAEQVNVARGHADRADSAASTAAGDVRAELASMVASAGAHVATASGHATTAAAKAGEAATSASAAATSATSAGDILVQVRSEREVAQAASGSATAAKTSAEAARDAATAAKQEAETARDDAREAASSLESGAPAEGWPRASLSSDVRDSLTRADGALTSVPRATAATPGGVQLTGDLAGTFDAPRVPGLAGKMDAMPVSSGVTTNSLVQRDGMGRIKTARPAADQDAATKKYVDECRSELEAATTSYVDDAVGAANGRISALESSRATRDEMNARPAMWLWNGVGTWTAPAGAVATDNVLNLATGEIHAVRTV